MCLDLVDPRASQSFSPNLFLPTLVLQTTPVRSGLRVGSMDVCRSSPGLVSCYTCSSGGRMD